MSDTGNRQKNGRSATNIAMVVAIAEHNAIGKDNALLWHLPADLKHFRTITTGHTIIMGRKTFESIGKPLPNRRNIVITRQNINPEGVEIADSITSALALCANEPEVYIIGGAEIYNASLPLTNRIYLTTVHQSFDADVFFPELNPEEWNKVNEVHHKADEKNSIDYTFSVLERK